MSESDLLKLEHRASELLTNLPKTVVGARIKRERLAQGLSIRALAKAANLGANSVVRLESGAEFRHVTLLKVCEALGIHIDRLAAAGPGTVAIHRRADDRWHELNFYGSGYLDGDGQIGDVDRQRAAREKGLNPLMLLQSRLETGKLLPTLIEVHHPTRPRSHPGEEFIYVLKGTARVTVSDVAYDLLEGESMEFWGTETHSYASLSDSPALLLSVRVNP